MRAQPTPAEPSTEPSTARVVRCDRIEAGAGTVLIRVTLVLGDLPVQDAAAAQLVAADRGHVLRREALPGPLPVAADTVTLGFAATAAAIPLGLWLGHEWIALSEADDARRAAELRLGSMEGDLEVSRSARALAELQRDDALHAAARAEAAAHDASARADALARRLPVATARGELPARRTTGPARRGPRTSSWRAAGAAGTLGCAAVLAILAWPARDGDGGRGVGEAAASAEVAGAQAPAPRPDDLLAARLKIPATYFALYRRAATRYGLDWARLAAVGAIESEHGQAPVAGIIAGSNLRGASGPAQFLPGTWERFGLDGDGDGARDPYDPADAIPAMASYLRASGAPQDWRGALHSYNHSDAYVTAVETLAASLRRDAS